MADEVLKFLVCGYTECGKSGEIAETRQQIESLGADGIQVILEETPDGNCPRGMCGQIFDVELPDGVTITEGDQQLTGIVRYGPFEREEFGHAPRVHNFGEGGYLDKMKSIAQQVIDQRS